MHLIGLLEAAQDQEGVRCGRLIHHDGLKPALQGGVLLHILAVLVQRSGTNALQLATGKGGLHQVGDVKPPATTASAAHGTSAHEGVDLVNHQDDAWVSLALCNELGYAALELATLLGSRHEQPHIQGQDALVQKELGHRVPVGVSAPDNGISQALGDGGLSDSRLSQQDGVILCATSQDLSHALHLLLAPEDRISFSLLHILVEVTAVLVGHFSLLFLP
mmetsp:Transcript_31818/g.90369  ORF Transcript_31818/g.90369 Transcript_31818/m.90369 type:complete len:220 (+) Transcript_31818:1333-1992(+)